MLLVQRTAVDSCLCSVVEKKVRLQETGGVGCASGTLARQAYPRGSHSVTDLQGAPPLQRNLPSLIYCRMHLLRTATCLVLVIGTTSGLGDRFAWSPVEVAEDTREGKLVEEVDEVVRNVRKVAEEDEKESKEQIEGRFVGKEVLCSLGLADVSMRKAVKEHFDQTHI